jgi:uncharacterized protein (DUF488 family)
MSKIYTIGHSNKSIDQFIDLLKSEDVQTLLDCRTSPRSRFCPQFNRGQMENALTAAGIKYEHRGMNMGGLAGNVDVQETYDEITARAEMGERMALCCSEGDIKNCHRNSVLTPAFQDHGLEVVHLLYGKEPLVAVVPTVQNQLF